MNASFEEKSVWIQLVALALVLSSYFVGANKMVVDGATELISYVPLFGASVGLLITLMIAGHILAAATGTQESPDERDRLIKWRAESNSSWVLAVGILGAITGLVISVETVNLAHFLIATLFLSEMAKLVFQIIYYRKGLTT